MRFESDVKHVIRGNAVLLQCPVPWHMGDFLSVTSWHRADGYVITRSTYGGKHIWMSRNLTRKCNSNCQIKNILIHLSNRSQYSAFYALRCMNLRCTLKPHLYVMHKFIHVYILCCIIIIRTSYYRPSVSSIRGHIRFGLTSWSLFPTQDKIKCFIRNG